jgi:hypothetical protein
MSARYRRWLIPKGGVFCPSGAGVVKLVDELKKGCWIAAPGSGTLASLRFQGAPQAAKTGGLARRVASVTTPPDPAAGVEPIPHPLDADWFDDADGLDVVLQWPIHPGDRFRWGTDSLRYPLTRLDDVAAPASLDFEIHCADDIVYPIAKGIGSLDAACRCGEDLAFEWDADEVISPFGSAAGIYTECEECSRTFDPTQREASVLDPFSRTRSPVRGGAAYRFALFVDCGASFPVGGAAPEFQPDLKALVESAFGRDFHEISALD